MKLDQKDICIYHKNSQSIFRSKYILGFYIPQKISAIGKDAIFTHCMKPARMHIEHYLLFRRKPCSIYKWLCKHRISILNTHHMKPDQS